MSCPLARTLRTSGDKQVLPALKERCDRLAEGQYYGGWTQTGLVAMAYTARLGNLRIAGKPRTEFSVPHRPTAVEASLPADDFQRTDFIEGATIDEKPHQIVEIFKTLYDESGKVISSGADASKNDKRKKRMPAAWYAKLMRHYSPTVRPPEA